MNNWLFILIALLFANTYEELEVVKKEIVELKQKLNEAPQNVKEEKK